MPSILPQIPLRRQSHPHRQRIRRGGVSPPYPNVGKITMSDLFTLARSCVLGSHGTYARECTIGSGHNRFQPSVSAFVAHSKSRLAERYCRLPRVR